MPTVDFRYVDGGTLMGCHGVASSGRVRVDESLRGNSYIAAHELAHVRQIQLGLPTNEDQAWSVADQCMQLDGAYMGARSVTFGECPPIRRRLITEASE